MAHPEGQQDFADSLRPTDPNAMPMDQMMKFRLALSEGLGREVFSVMLWQLGLFEKIPQGDAEAVANHNYAIELLTSMGIITIDNIQRIADALLSVPLENKEK